MLSWSLMICVLCVCVAMMNSLFSIRGVLKKIAVGAVGWLCCRCVAISFVVGLGIMFF